MDEDETTPGASNFPTGAKPKRKKMDSADDDGNYNLRLLGNNAYIALEHQASNNQAAPSVSRAENSAANRKQPPLVVKNVDIATLVEKMRECKAQPLYKITRFGIKINCASAEMYSVVENHLKRLKYEYYTHDKPNQRPYRVVLRGLPLADPQNVLDRLKEDHNVVAEAIHIIRRKGEYASMDESFYLVHFAKGYTNLKKLAEVKHIGQIIVRWEAYRNKRADVTQCMNCLYHGHGTKNCHLKSRCNHCGGSHASERCPEKSAPAKRCANCNGAHPATDRSCPKRAEYIRIRQQLTTSNQPGRRTERKRAPPPPPEMNAKEFPSLPPSLAPPVVSCNGGAQRSDVNLMSHPQHQDRRIDPRVRAETNAPPASSSSRPQAGMNPPSSSPRSRTGTNAPSTSSASVENENDLYSPAQLWSIFTEFCERLKQCKTRADQTKVVGYLICKYGVN